VLATRSSAWLEWDDMVASCARADIAVSDRWLPRGCTPKWLKLDRKALERTGGIAIYLQGKPRVDTVAGEVGLHPWATAGRK
jgi:competence protein ComEC